MKAKAKEIQRIEQETIRHQEANRWPQDFLGFVQKYFLFQDCAGGDWRTKEAASGGHGGPADGGERRGAGEGEDEEGAPQGRHVPHGAGEGAETFEPPVQVLLQLGLPSELGGGGTVTRG